MAHLESSSEKRVYASGEKAKEEMKNSLHWFALGGGAGGGGAGVVACADERF